MKKLVSIVMATFNGEKFIRPQVDSILSQSYTNIELIVIDDASRDQTAKIIAEYVNKDCRVKFYQNEKNLGVVKSFEKGLKLCNGPLIALADQDDIFLGNKLEFLVNRINTNPNPDMVISDAKLINQHGDVIADSLWEYQNLKPFPGKNFALIVNDNYATGCTLIFKKKILKTALPFPENIHMHDWWLAVVSSSNQYNGIAVLKDRLTLYRQHQNNVFGAQKVKSGFIKSFKRIFNKPKRNDNNKKAIYLRHIKRLEAYLLLNFWTLHEVEILFKTLFLYKGLYLDYSQPLKKRIFKIPFRVMFFLRQKKYKEVIRVVLLTICPSV